MVVEGAMPKRESIIVRTSWMSAMPSPKMAVVPEMRNQPRACGFGWILRFVHIE